MHTGVTWERVQDLEFGFDEPGEVLIDLVGQVHAMCHRDSGAGSMW